MKLSAIIAAAVVGISISLSGPQIGASEQPPLKVEDFASLT